MVAFNDDGTQELRRRIAELEEKVNALLEAEDRCTIALANSDVGIFDWNLANQQVYVSPILQDMLGYGPEGLPGDPLSWIEHVQPEDRYRVQAELREALMYGREAFQGAYKVSHTDGEPRLLLFRAIIMRRSRLDGGDAHRILGTAIDVTHFKSPTES